VEVRKPNYSFELPIRRVRGCPTTLGIRLGFVCRCVCVCVCVFVCFLVRRHLSIDRSTTIIAIDGGDRCSLNDGNFNLVYNCSVLLLCYCFCRFSPLAVEKLVHSALNCKTVWWPRWLRIITIFQVVFDLDLCDVGGVPDTVESCRIPCHTWSQLEMEQAGNFKSNCRQLAYNQIK